MAETKVSRVGGPPIFGQSEYRAITISYFSLPNQIWMLELTMSRSAPPPPPTFDTVSLPLHYRCIRTGHGGGHGPGEGGARYM